MKNTNEEKLKNGEVGVKRDFLAMILQYIFLYFLT